RCALSFAGLRCAAAPQARTSFPTRRSSDLELRTLFADDAETARQLVLDHRLGRRERALTMDHGKLAAPLLPEDHRQPRHLIRHRDRKSTRLNSTHGSTSYALLCLP